MSISAIVPVWNGRDLLAKLLDTLDAQTRAPAELLVVDTAPPTGRRNWPAGGAPASFPWPQRGLRGRRQSRNPRKPRTMDRRPEQRRRAGPDYFAILAAADGWFATGKILRRSGGSIDGTFDAVCRGACAWRVGAAGPTARYSPLRAPSAPLPGPPPCSAPTCSAAWAASRRVSNRTWKTSISDCAAPPKDWRALRAACRRLAPWQCDPGPMASRNRSAHRPQPAPDCGPPLSPACIAALRVAHRGGATPVGRGRVAARCGSGMAARKVAGAARLLRRAPCGRPFLILEY